MRAKIVVGSRGSKLALIQTESVVAALQKLYPRIDISICKIVTQGDRNPHVQLDHMESVGVFVKELEEALLDNRIDLAVHSLKDMPTELPSELYLVGVMERADARDVLVSRCGKLADMPAGSKVGTGSQRRAVQICRLRPDFNICGIRGNVDTRLRKVASGEIDGVILAAAAMKRLGWDDRVTEYLPAEQFLPAVGQGVIAIEGRRDDEETRGLVAALNHKPTWYSMSAERAFLYALGGGCRAPIAALGVVAGQTLKLDGMVASVRSREILRGTESGNINDSDEIGMRLAKRLLDMGASKYIAEARA